MVKLITPNTQRLQSIKITKEIIESSANRLKNLVDNYDAYILIIPSRALWIGNKQQKGMANQIHNEFLVALDHRKLRFIDMRVPMEKTKDPLQYHFKNDGHWNKFGHFLAAEELKKIIP